MSDPKNPFHVMETPDILVPLADGFEEMEGIILIDVLRRAGLNVITASLKKGEIVAARKTRHLADTELDEVKDLDFDMIVLPGGAQGAINLEKDDRIADILRKHKEKGRYIGAICAAPNVLRNHGILEENDPFTMHPGSLTGGSGGSFREGQRVVQFERILTSIGPGSAFEFALALVEELLGKEAREKTEAPMYLS